MVTPVNVIAVPANAGSNAAAPYSITSYVAGFNTDVAQFKVSVAFAAFMGSVNVSATPKSSAFINEMAGTVLSAAPVVKVLETAAASGVVFNPVAPVVTVMVYIVFAVRADLGTKNAWRSKGLYSTAPFTAVLPTVKVMVDALIVEGSISFENPMLTAPTFTGTPVSPVFGYDPTTVGAAVSALVPVVNSDVKNTVFTAVPKPNVIPLAAFAPPNTFSRYLVLATKAPESELYVLFKPMVAEVFAVFNVTVSMALELTFVSVPLATVKSCTKFFKTYVPESSAIGSENSITILALVGTPDVPGGGVVPCTWGGTNAPCPNDSVPENAPVKDELLVVKENA